MMPSPASTPSDPSAGRASVSRSPGNLPTTQLSYHPPEESFGKRDAPGARVRLVPIRMVGPEGDQASEHEVRTLGGLMERYGGQETDAASQPEFAPDERVSRSMSEECSPENVAPGQEEANGRHVLTGWQDRNAGLHNARSQQDATMECYALNSGQTNPREHHIPVARESLLDSQDTQPLIRDASGVDVVPEQHHKEGPPASEEFEHFIPVLMELPKESEPRRSEERSTFRPVLHRGSSFRSRAGPPKKVHFAAEPEVQVYETLETYSLTLNGGLEGEDSDLTYANDGDRSEEKMETSWLPPDEEQEMQEDVRQGKDKAGPADDFPEMSKNEQRTDHGAFHAEGKRRRMLEDGTSTVEDEEHVRMVLLRPPRQTCFGQQTSLSPVAEPPTSHYAVSETEQTVPKSETSLSVQFIGSKSRTPVSQAPSNLHAPESLAMQDVFEVTESHHIPGSLTGPGSDITPEYSSLISLPKTASAPSVCPVSANSSPSVSSIPSQPLSETQTEGASGHTSANAGQLRTSARSPPLSSQQHADISSPPLILEPSAPALPPFAQPPADGAQPPSGTEEAPLAGYQPPERPLSPLIRLLLRGISHRAARPYGRTSPLLVRGGERKSPFRSPADGKGPAYPQCLRQVRCDAGRGAFIFDHFQFRHIHSEYRVGKKY